MNDPNKSSFLLRLFFHSSNFHYKNYHFCKNMCLILLFLDFNYNRLHNVQDLGILRILFGILSLFSLIPVWKGYDLTYLFRKIVSFFHYLLVIFIGLHFKLGYGFLYLIHCLHYLDWINIQ